MLVESLAVVGAVFLTLVALFALHDLFRWIRGKLRQ